MPSNLLDNLSTMLNDYDRDLVVCHESDPQWRASILKEVPSLLSLRKTGDTYSEPEYGILSLTLRHMKFRVRRLFFIR